MFFLWVKIIKTKNINSNFESFTCEDRSEVSIDITNSLIELIISTVKEANIEEGRKGTQKRDGDIDEGWGHRKARKT